MATEPLTNETIALTEKKVDMALDDIIKMSKSNVNKGKKPRTIPNKTQNISNGAAKYNTLKARHYIDSRSAVRQGAFAKRRSNFQGNQFPVTSNIARKAATALPLRGRLINAGRMAKTNQSRFVAPPVQNRAAHGGFNAKRQRGENIEQKQATGGPRQRSQTLDSLFANMKEERMKRFSQRQHQQQPKSQQQQQRSDTNGVQRPRVPWARGRRWGN